MRFTRGGCLYRVDCDGALLVWMIDANQRLGGYFTGWALVIPQHALMILQPTGDPDA